jgi:secreted trypsin-like serine protease
MSYLTTTFYGLTFLVAQSATASEPYTFSLSKSNSIYLKAHGVAPYAKTGSDRIDNKLIGSEKSECRDYGRQSSALGMSDVSVISQSDDRLSFEMASSAIANGGHYRTCGICASGNCVGVFGNDTSSQSRSTSTSILAIKFKDDSDSAKYIIDVGIAGQGKAPTLIATDQQGKPIELLGESGRTFLVTGFPKSVYYISTSVENISANSGGCCSDANYSNARIDVSLRKAPILISRKSFEPFIKGGAETKSYKNVGAILIDGQLHCTGTVVGNKTILTAAHCLHGYEKQYEKFTFVIGSNLLQPTLGPVKLVEFVYPKGEMVGFRFNPTTLEDDIALVYVDNATGIVPAKLHHGAPTWQSIQSGKTSLTFVGYGFDVVDDEKVGAGIKREASWAIDSVENRRVTFSVLGKNTCKGDSGGPAFLIASSTITQVALTSGGTSDCTMGFETRLDAYAAWLAGKIR